MLSSTSSRSGLTHWSSIVIWSGSLCDPGLTAAQMRPIELPIRELWHRRQLREAYVSAHHLLGALPDRPLSTLRFILLYKTLHMAHLKII